jgi:hypothetical protein
MYRCDICKYTSDPKEPRRVRAVKRRDGNIERELSLCASCAAEFDRASGVAPRTVKEVSLPRKKLVVKLNVNGK